MFFLRLPLSIARVLFFLFHQIVYIPRMIVLFLWTTFQLVVYSIYYSALRLVNYKTSYVIYIYKQTGFLYFLGRFIWSCLFITGCIAIIIFYVGAFYPFIMPFLLYYLYGSAPYALSLLLYIWSPLIFLAMFFDYGAKYIMT